MMSKRRDQAADLCVLRIDVTILKSPGIVLSDSNASSKYARFLAPSQWTLLPFDEIYAHDWRDPDQITFWRKRARKCAECLVPHCVDLEFLVGAYVLDAPTRRKLLSAGFKLPISIDPVLFFH